MADYNSKYTGSEIDSAIGKVLNNADIIIKNCIFKNGKENVSDVSWHFF